MRLLLRFYSEYFIVFCNCACFKFAAALTLVEDAVLP